MPQTAYLRRMETGDRVCGKVTWSLTSDSFGILHGEK
jgi:hypothetical protein